jgi:hypothetical protein
MPLTLKTPPCGDHRPGVDRPRIVASLADNDHSGWLLPSDPTGATRCPDGSNRPPWRIWTAPGAPICAPPAEEARRLR